MGEYSESLDSGATPPLEKLAVSKELDTGFLPKPEFSYQKKLFLEEFRRCFPRIMFACRAAGVHYRAFDAWYDEDQAFHDEVDLIRRERVENVEGVLYENAHNKAGFMDRIAILRAEKGEKYNPDHKVTVTHKAESRDARPRLERLQDAIDAEIVDSPHLVNKLTDMLSSPTDGTLRESTPTGSALDAESCPSIPPVPATALPTEKPSPPDPRRAGPGK